MVYAGSGENIRREGEVLILIPDLIQFLAIKQGYNGYGHKIGNSVVCGRVELCLSGGKWKVETAIAKHSLSVPYHTKRTLPLPLTHGLNNNNTNIRSRGRLESATVRTLAPLHMDYSSPPNRFSPTSSLLSSAT
ncbi:hypothetical protein VNO80_04476 [Phaseolus coccineus]|uniref:Uncharacterized protein n=1 Tax=Phaseolus coccineus TaxID=3886 RepID=A0AAN9RNS1_PHACN